MISPPGGDSRYLLPTELERSNSFNTTLAAARILILQLDDIEKTMLDSVLVFVLIGDCTPKLERSKLDFLIKKWEEGRMYDYIF